MLDNLVRKLAHKPFYELVDKLDYVDQLVEHLVNQFVDKYVSKVVHHLIDQFARHQRHSVETDWPISWSKYLSTKCSTNWCTN